MRLLLVLAAYGVALSGALGWRGVRAPGRAVAAAGTGSRRVAPRRILVVGATGGTGRQLVAQALARGHAVTALVRTPASLDLAHDRLRVVRGDILDPGAVADAVQGQDAVVSALGHRRFVGPTRILSEGTRNLVRAMQAHGVSRLVCVTSLGIGSSAGRMGPLYTFFVIPWILPFYFWDKARQERVIAETGLEWIIVRPSVLTDAPARGGVRHGPGVGSFFRPLRISRADVAAFMLDQVGPGGYVRTTPGVSW